MKVSVVQFYPKLLEVQSNLDRLTAMLQNVASDLIVLPELVTSGYVFNSLDEVESVAEKVPDGLSFTTFTALAKKLNSSIVYGFPEKVKDDTQHSVAGSFIYYNSCALLNPDGSYYVYRKVHLFNREKLFFTPGGTPFNAYPAKDGVLIGMMICFDWQFPEAARSLALKGAQIICHPANLVLPWCQQAMKTRSLENRVYSITANRIGTETNGEQSEIFTGESQILGTKGEVLAALSIDGEGVATVIIDPQEACNKQVSNLNNAFKDRRPELYAL